MSIATLDEQALRRPEFSGGHAVKLADSQPWHFPAVKVMGAFPHERADGSMVVVWRPAYADEYAEDLDMIFGVADGNQMDVDEAEMRLAVGLIKQNYDLPRGSVGRLLPRLLGDPANRLMWERVINAVLGRDPGEGRDGEAKAEEIDGDPKGPTPPG